MRPHEIFQDTEPWVDYLPDTWAALRSDNWDHMPFDPKKIYQRFDNKHFKDKKTEDFNEEIRIFNALSHALVYGHYFNCHPSDLFAAEQLDRANKEKGIVSKNFLKFWRPILGIYVAWANLENNLEGIRHKKFYSPKIWNKIELDEFVYDHKWILNSLTHMRAQGGEDPYHLASHLEPQSSMFDHSFEQKIDTYENLTYLTFKIQNFHQLERLFQNKYPDSYALVRVDINKFGTLGHFLYTPERHLFPDKKYLSYTPVRFIPDTQVREIANKAFKLRNEL